MDVRPIRNDEDLAWAIAEVTPYFQIPPALGTPEADRFDVLSDLIESYEGRSFEVEAEDPIAFLEAFMAITGRTQADLARLLNSPSRASEVLHRKRALTVDMIHRLASAWGAPPAALTIPYDLTRKRPAGSTVTRVRAGRPRAETRGRGRSTLG
jgi:HTH-type transcriptional regulator/antitoxin HigA